jgi:hypothetical protein
MLDAIDLARLYIGKSVRVADIKLSSLMWYCVC